MNCENQNQRKKSLCTYCITSVCTVYKFMYHPHSPANLSPNSERRKKNKQCDNTGNDIKMKQIAELMKFYIYGTATMVEHHFKTKTLRPSSIEKKTYFFYWWCTSNFFLSFSFVSFFFCTARLEHFFFWLWVCEAFVYFLFMFWSQSLMRI